MVDIPVDSVDELLLRADAYASEKRSGFVLVLPSGTTIPLVQLDYFFID